MVEVRVEAGDQLYARAASQVEGGNGWEKRGFETDTKRRKCNQAVLVEKMVGIT